MKAIRAARPGRSSGVREVDIVARMPRGLETVNAARRRARGSGARAVAADHRRRAAAA
jgi:hypothetical protein